MADYLTIKTLAGLALDAAAATGQKISLTMMALGDGAGDEYTPSPDQTSLKGEKVRVPLNALSQQNIDPTQWVAEAIFEADHGGFTAREAGLFTEDGVLYAIANIPPVYRPSLEEGAAGQFILSLNFAVSDASSIVITVDPAKSYVTLDYLNTQLGKYVPLTGGDVSGPLMVTKPVGEGSDSRATAELGVSLDSTRLTTQMTKMDDGHYLGKIGIHAPDNVYREALRVDENGRISDNTGAFLLNEVRANETYLPLKGGDVTGTLSLESDVFINQTPPVDDRSKRAANTEWVLQALRNGIGLNHFFEAESGFCELPGGLIIQWGQALSTQGFPFMTLCNFKIRFPNQCFGAWVNERNAGGTWAPAKARPTLFGVVDTLPNRIDVRGVVWADEPNHWPTYAASFAYLAIGF